MMNRFPAISATILLALLLTFSACKKSEPAAIATPEKPEAAQPVTEVKKAAPVLPAGTWIGTVADGSVAATLMVDTNNRMTVIQQDSPSSGAYSIDESVTPALLSFMPDQTPGKTYTSQIQWIDARTINMTSLVEGPPSTNPVVPQPPVEPATPAAPAPAPFTGGIPSPQPLPNPPDVSSAEPVIDPVVVTITFRLQ